MHPAQETCGGRSSRTADSFRIILNQPGFEDFMVIPCQFKERIDFYCANKNWLPALAEYHRFELLLSRDGARTYIRGPFWSSFLRSHTVVLNYVVTFSLIRPGAEEEAEESDED